MIQFEHLRIEEFRGIRSIDLALGSDSFVVYGPNGSGKSGIVDAIDFAITGDIARLKGAGTSDVSVAKHGPHVHKRDDPGAAKVYLTVKDPDTNESAILARSVKSPKKYTLTPDTPAMRAAIDAATSHPELTLSRRELIKYVVSKPGDRAAEVQTLLKLDRVDAVRKLLRTTSTRVSTESKTANSEKGLSETTFLSHLSLTKLLSTEVLREINNRRATLGLDDLTAIDDLTDFLSGYSGEKKSGQIDLSTAKDEATSLVSTASTPSTLKACHGAFMAGLISLSAQPQALDSIKHRSLLDVGLKAVEGPQCPLCESDWPTQEALEDHLKTRIQETTEAESLKQVIVAAASTYQTALRKLREDIVRVMPSAKIYGDAELPHLLQSWSDSLHIQANELSKFDDVTKISPDEDATPYAPSSQVLLKLEALQSALQAAPDYSQETSAQTFLSVAKDRWARVRLARSSATKADAAQKAASTIYNSYCESLDGVLADLYATVETEFSAYYQFVNSDDEGSFRAELLPSAGSLDLSVDFHELGMFPPSAYHSEGHQDGMGVCLYLALVNQLLGDDFRYAVLDDVVMSVDSNHRRKFGELLKTKFPNVQFIITTHDEVWARQMRSAGVVKAKSMARFYGWTVDGGPAFSQGDVWARIEEDLTANDVPGAAHKLRRMMEADTADIVERLAGQVKYRSDAAYDLSTFVDSVKGRHGQLLKIASDSAQSWNDQAQIDRVNTLKAARSAAIPEQDKEAWLVNKLVHNSDWTNATVADFRPVMDATKNFLALFKCANVGCESWIGLSGKPGDEDSLRCACQTYNLNLRKKK